MDAHGEEKNQADDTLHQYLTFTIENDLYGIDILRVREIKGWGGVREVPNTPDYLKGVINLRGLMVPVVDLRLRFGMEQIEYTPVTVIIVLAVNTDEGEMMVGFVVDAVADVMDVDDQHFRKIPKLGTRIDTRFMKGMAVVDERMVVLLEIDQIMHEEELKDLHEVSHD
jgi:purine-binding chemotaxis protein CheW